MITTLFFLGRHGRTAGNDKNIYRGWSNDEFAQLDSDGRDDAREEGIFLQGVGYDFPVIFSDDLDRTVETAQIVAGILGIKEHIKDKRLRPIDVGDFTGKSKTEHPLDEYLKDKSKKIPGGQSLNEFNATQSKVFADIAEFIAQTKKPVVVIGHGSNACYLYTHVNKRGSEVGYEGLTEPGGVSLFTRDGITPIFKKREGAPQLYTQGTNVSGFVTDEENRPPRECWNCRNFVKIGGLGACTHILVRIDPQIKERRQSDGTIAVGDRDCCNNFRNKIST